MSRPSYFEVENLFLMYVNGQAVTRGPHVFSTFYPYDTSRDHMSENEIDDVRAFNAQRDTSVIGLNPTQEQSQQVSSGRRDPPKRIETSQASRKKLQKRARRAPAAH